MYNDRKTLNTIKRFTKISSKTKDLDLGAGWYTDFRKDFFETTILENKIKLFMPMGLVKLEAENHILKIISESVDQGKYNKESYVYKNCKFEFLLTEYSSQYLFRELAEQIVQENYKYVLILENEFISKNDLYLCFREISEINIYRLITFKLIKGKILISYFECSNSDSSVWERNFSYISNYAE